MQRTVIGVLTYRRKRTFDEPAYFRQLSKEGQKLSSEVCFFSEDDLIYSNVNRSRAFKRGDLS
ncbi:hypothetical protein GMA19_03718 [Paenibacillus polymyxa E681]|uniref:hypothetical protein n=1 Tax=Paenibacillus polymyxa TaxID=1406 RepID=UPI0002D2B89A|nr:hypothetical protein [Paenibacillus polymyxa]AJW69309.1 hypothetical protein PPE_06220 [Paenibacillus polymyxa E681]QNV58532.1 hypothetical protein GE561_03720 [Paenibacillus polymyxa E681]QNV63367.1 hypothetical protein GMA19_03718 [Paenibacillus polymyxa E681]URJ47153.1 hypothetical protein MF628_001762 [Paenibacillus polymyxa]